MVKRRRMRGRGEVGKFEEDGFKMREEDYLLIGRGEVGIRNMDGDEMLWGEKVGMNYAALRGWLG